MSRFQVAGQEVEVVRKDIRHLHLAVFPPDGRVRVTAPFKVQDDVLRRAVVRRLTWIRKHQAKFTAQERQPLRRFISGETHFAWGKRHRLRVVEKARTWAVRLAGPGWMEMTVPHNATIRQKEHLLQAWYRRQMKAVLPDLLKAWEGKLGVEVKDWGVKQMRTRWGSCIRQRGRIWVNLELAKKPQACLEYIVAHELAHLLVPGHGDDFKAILDKHLASWRHLKAALNQEPLRHEEWEY